MELDSSSNDEDGNNAPNTMDTDSEYAPPPCTVIPPAAKRARINVLSPALVTA